MRKLLCAVVFCAGATIASAQVADFSVSGGVSRFGGTTLISDPASGINVTTGDGFRLAIRFALNTYRFFGHEIGYGYARSKADFGSQGSLGLNIHSFGYNFLAYATPEGSRIRPFGTVGAHFSSFIPAGQSIYYSTTKFGFNYGGGLKFRLTGPWGGRIDVRQYNTGKPDLFQTTVAPSGRLKQTEVSVGVMVTL